MRRVKEIQNQRQRFIAMGGVCHGQSQRASNTSEKTHQSHLNLSASQTDVVGAVAASVLGDGFGDLVSPCLYVVRENIALVTTIVRCHRAPMVKLNYCLN